MWIRHFDESQGWILGLNRSQPVNCVCVTANYARFAVISFFYLSVELFLIDPDCNQIVVLF